MATHARPTLKSGNWPKRRAPSLFECRWESTNIAPHKPNRHTHMRIHRDCVISHFLLATTEITSKASQDTNPHVYDLPPVPMYTPHHVTLLHESVKRWYSCTEKKSFSPTGSRVGVNRAPGKIWSWGNCLKLEIEGYDWLRLWLRPITELVWAGANERRASILVWSVRSSSHCGKAGFQVSPIFLNIFSEIRGEMCVKVILNGSCKGIEWGWLEKLVDFDGLGGGGVWRDSVGSLKVFLICFMKYWLQWREKCFSGVHAWKYWGKHMHMEGNANTPTSRLNEARRGVYAFPSMCMCFPQYYHACTPLNIFCQYFHIFSYFHFLVMGGVMCDGDGYGVLGVLRVFQCHVLFLSLLSTRQFFVLAWDTPQTPPKPHHYHHHTSAHWISPQKRGNFSFARWKAIKSSFSTPAFFKPVIRIAISC